MASNQIKHLGGKVKPIISLNRTDARRRALNLYRAWYRQIPYIIYDMDLPVNQKQLRDKVREKFLENKDVADIRMIDIHIIRGHNELNDSINKFKSLMHYMAYFDDNTNKKPKDFLSKFLSGQN